MSCVFKVRPPGHLLNSFIVGSILSSPCVRWRSWGATVGGIRGGSRQRRWWGRGGGAWEGAGVMRHHRVEWHSAEVTIRSTIRWWEQLIYKQTPEQTWWACHSVSFEVNTHVAPQQMNVQANCHPGSFWASACGCCHLSFRKPATDKKTPPKTKEQKNDSTVLQYVVSYSMYVKLPVLHSTSRKELKVQPPEEL